MYSVSKAYRLMSLNGMDGFLNRLHASLWVLQAMFEFEGGANKA